MELGDVLEYLFRSNVSIINNGGNVQLKKCDVVWELYTFTPYELLNAYVERERRIDYDNN